MHSPRRLLSPQASSRDASRHSRVGWWRAAISVAAVGVLVGVAGPANAAVPEPLDDTTTATDTVIVDGPEMSVAPGPTSIQREPKDKGNGASTNAVTIGTCYAGAIGNSGRTTRGTAYIEVGFSSKVVWSGFGCFTGTFNGTSYGKWTGSGNATKITLRDEFSYAGVGGVSISASPGASIVGGVIKWSGSASNTRQVTHKFTGYSFSGALFTVTESASMTAQFGSSFYTANA